MDLQQTAPPEGQTSSSFRNFSQSSSLRTYENRTNNHMRPLNQPPPHRLSDAPLAVPTAPPAPNRTNVFIIGPASPQGIVLQGRHFQHAQLPSTARKPVQRDELSSTQQPLEVDSIVLTCPEVPEEETLNIKRRVQQKRKPLEICTFSPQIKSSEPPRPACSPPACPRCSKDGGWCQTCGTGASSPPTPRPPIRPGTRTQPGTGTQTPPGPAFYRPGASMRLSDAGLLPLTNGKTQAPPPRGRRAPAGAKHALNDPIVLSSDDEDADDTASTGSINRMDSVSPRPADSAHSSPAPSGGRVEAAVKSSRLEGSEETDEPGGEFFHDVNMRITIPRRARMKDQFGNQPPESVPRTKKPKLAASKCESIILECRSIRIGTLRRMVKKPVVFSIDHIELETEGPSGGGVETVCLRASELVSCEWCNVRKLPVLFFQTTPAECLRLRTELNMSREDELWYDCSGDEMDEKFIVLIFENGLAMKEQMILEDILAAVGRTNNLSDFPAKLSFEEANIRLVNYNRAASSYSRAASSKVNPSPSPPKGPQGPQVTPPSTPAGPPLPSRTPTRTCTRQQTRTFFQEDEDMTDLQPTFSGPIVKLMVYPPPPAKGGMSVTNEDLHCLNDGEFLNDVIIDFYLKYLVLEKLRKEDSQRIHVFSSFFYKRLNLRERRNGPDTANLPIQKRKHNRVKTWTRHVDLFQKDFIFVPINESAHWYLAVICFPGLEAPVLEPSPLVRGLDLVPGPGPGPEPGQDPGLGPEENFPDHCRPLSPDGDDSCSDRSSPPVPEGPVGGPGDHHPVLGGLRDQDPDRGSSAHTGAGPEPLGAGPDPLGAGPADPEQQQYSSELHRISVCYGSVKDDDDTFNFSDDQSSCQDECSEDGSPPLPDDPPSSSSSPLKTTVCRQPCILIMDSLRGPTRSGVVKTLREYLEVEWQVRKGSQRSFRKDVVKGSSPRVPQQDNFSDCGVYVLQYVESFFENPVRSFQLPLSLQDWFPPTRMKTKRDEIRNLILQIQQNQNQNLDRVGPDPDLDLEPGRTRPGSPEEPEVEET
ncbi:sentrin-specific protease 6 isoform X2 [Cololabis saira]|nr:sentrin-specific protease 6 isoform X2 [Cololabis saira]